MRSHTFERTSDTERAPVLGERAADVDVQRQIGRVALEPGGSGDRAANHIALRMRHYLGRDRDAGCDYLGQIVHAVEVLRSGDHEHGPLAERYPRDGGVLPIGESHLDGPLDRRHVRGETDVTVLEGQRVQEAVVDLGVRILGTVAVEALGPEEQDLVVLHLEECLPVCVEPSGLGGRPVDRPACPDPLQEETV